MSDDRALELPGQIVGDKYRLGRRVGSGSFGDIHIGTSLVSGVDYALKLELDTSSIPQLRFEYRLYRALQDTPGLPQFRWFGTSRLRHGNYNVLAMELLGSSLEDLFVRRGRRFTLKTQLLIIEQVLTRIELVHNAGWVHRDLKPDNILMGLGSKASLIHLIDFGLVKRYKDSVTGEHIAFRDGKNLTGTPRYASINNHLGLECSRRDDLETLGFGFMYFAKGSLPWMGLHGATKEVKYNKILARKREMTNEALCAVRVRARVSVGALPPLTPPLPPAYISGLSQGV